MLSVANVRTAGGAANYFAADNYYTRADADRSGEWLGKGAAALGLAAMAGLSGINGNGWAWLALPLLAAATRLRLPIRRHRDAFYVYYPLHLAVLWAIRWLSA